MTFQRRRRRSNPTIEEGTHKQKAKFLLSMTQKEADDFIKSFDIVICNCEGVLWQYIDDIPDTGIGLMALKSAGKQIKFYSTNSIRSDSDYQQKLRTIEFYDVKPSDIITPGKVMLNYLKTYYTGLKVFSLCCNELNDMFRSNGIKVETMEPAVQITMHELMEKITPDTKISAVLYDLNFNLTYLQLAKAQQYLCQESCAFVVSFIDTFVNISKEFSTIGTAGIVSILRENSTREPIALGKSGATLGEEIISTHNIRDPSRVLYIGDNLFTDIPFGHHNGFQNLFVLTGVSKLDQVAMLLEEQKPEFITDSVADFVQFFKKFG